MFCPKCSAQNEAEQKYCRRCGLPLAILRTALEGRVDEAVALYKKGGGALSGSTVILFLCLFGALINLFLIPGPWNGYAVAVNSIVGLLIALPMIISGHVRLKRAGRLLSSEDKTDRSIAAETTRSATPLPPAAITDPLPSPLSVAGSVTEHTTLNLKSPERPH